MFLLLKRQKDLIKTVTEICAKGNVRLYKFLSNDKEVLTSESAKRSRSTTTGTDNGDRMVCLLSLQQSGHKQENHKERGVYYQ